MSPVASLAVTADELLTMPDGDRFELVDGELQEREMGAIAGWVGTQVIIKLGNYCETHGGTAFGDGVGICCYSDDPDRVRKPDASYFRPGRLPQIPEGFIPVAPDLVVEVVSPSDLYRNVEDKVEEYLDAGVALVWVLSPTKRSVRIFRHDAPIEQLRANDVLTGGDVLPGFSCVVGDLFPPVPAP